MTVTVPFSVFTVKIVKRAHNSVFITGGEPNRIKKRTISVFFENEREPHRTKKRVSLTKKRFLFNRTNLLMHFYIAWCGSRSLASGIR